MKFKDRYNISKGYENLFSFRDEKDELDFEAHMLMFRFLSEVEKIYEEDKNLKKKDLASKLGVSPSYITQVFNGDKMMNFTMLAKIQKAYNLTFEIKSKKNEQSHTSKSTEKMSHTSLHVNQLSEDNPDYKKSI